MDGRVMYSDRDSIHEDIRKRLVKIKGIGPEKAAKGSDAVMEYLDSLVQNQAGSSPKPGERDEDGIEMIKRPKEIPEEFNYLYWGDEARCSWIHHYKPVDFDGSNYTCDTIDEIDEHSEHPLWLKTDLSITDILSQTRLFSCNERDRIVRLVD